jgi:acetyl-CoA carboxylase biotin carboxyl carrier protein
MCVEYRASGIQFISFRKLLAKTPLAVILNSTLSRKDAQMAEKDTDLQKIKELIEIMKENDLVEIEIKHGDDKIFLKRSTDQQPIVTAVPMAGLQSGAATLEQPIATGSLSPQQQEQLLDIKSPIVGTFYATPSPDSAPYVEIGSRVEPQTVVCIIEAMKVMNEIKAETSGTIAEILVTNGQAVEYGRVLFRVRPD